MSTIIGRELTSISLDHNPNLEKNFKNEKSGSLDIKAALDFENPCNIEMQLERDNTIEKRLLFYWSMLYSNNVKSGVKHGDLKKTISILIANFELNSLREIHNYHTEWKIREKNYSKVVLTNDLEFHILELPKLKKAIDANTVSKEEKRLALWGKFLLNPDELEEDEVVDEEEIRLAQQELDRLRKSREEINRARNKSRNRTGNRKRNRT